MKQLIGIIVVLFGLSSCVGISSSIEDYDDTQVIVRYHHYPHFVYRYNYYPYRYGWVLRPSYHYHPYKPKYHHLKPNSHRKPNSNGRRPNTQNPQHRRR